jgi:predicted O-methyltransferase YrrM
MEVKSKARVSSDGLDRGRFTFQRSWFDEDIRPEWETLTVPLRGTKLNILEVGSFEGASTTWILDNLMTRSESRMTAIDTFEGGMEHLDPDQVHQYDISSLESRFRSNISKCEHMNKLRVMKAKSDDALLDLRREGALFDFIYIDASHVAIDVLHDAVICWRMLSVHGTMVFDDVAWKGYMEDCYNPRIAIRSFVQCAVQEVETKETEAQMWVTKVPNRIPATPNPDPALYYWDNGLAVKQ